MSNRNENLLALRDSWPHPHNPSIKVTNSPETFQILKRDQDRDGVILKRPGDIIKRTHPAAIETATALLTTEYITGPYSADIKINPQEEILGLSQLPQEFTPLHTELSEMFRACIVMPANSFTFIATNDASFLQSRTIKHPVLVAQWQIPSSKTGLANEEGLILQSGDWAYFQPGVKLNFSPNDEKKTFLTMIVKPLEESPGTEPV